MYLLVFLLVLLGVISLFNYYMIKVRLNDPINIAALLGLYIIESDYESVDESRLYMALLFVETFSLSKKEVIKVYSHSYSLMKSHNAFVKYRKEIDQVIRGYSFEQLESTHDLIIRCAVYSKCLTKTQTERLNEVQSLLIHNQKHNEVGPEKPQWCNRSYQLSNLNAEIVYLLNTHIDLTNETFTLKLPDFPRAVVDQVTTLEALDNLNSLHEYYRQIHQIKKRENLNAEQVRHYFWARLYFWHCEVDKAVSFPWYDDLDDMKQFMSWLRYGSNTINFYDMDQGWQMNAHVSDGILYIMQANDQGDELSNLAVPYQVFVEMINTIELRAAKVNYALTKKAKALE